MAKFLTSENIEDLQERIAAMVRCNPETADEWGDICAMEDVVSDWQKAQSLEVA